MRGTQARGTPQRGVGCEHPPVASAACHPELRARTVWTVCRQTRLQGKGSHRTVIPPPPEAKQCQGVDESTLTQFPYILHRSLKSEPLQQL